MKGFIVVSIDPKSIKQSIGLEEHMLRYTSVISEDAKEIPPQFNEHFPNQTILLTIPVDTLKKNIELVDQMLLSQQVTA